MIKNILIATVLPNGINSNNGNYQFSVCFDINKNINPDNYTADQLHATLKSLFTMIDGFADQGLSLKVDGVAVDIPAQQVHLFTDKAKLREIRQLLWEKVFNYTLSSIPVVEKGMFNSFPSTSDLLGSNIVKGDLRALSEAKVKALSSVLTGTVSSIAAADDQILTSAKQLMTDFATSFESLWSKIDGIRKYSEEISTQQRNAFYEKGFSRVLSSTENLALAISTENIFDSVSILCENPIVQKISGFTCDFEIPQSVLNNSRMQLAFSPKKGLGIDDAWIIPLSSVYIYTNTKNGKSKKLVLLEGQSADCAGIYQSTELKLFNHDKLSKTEAIRQVYEQLKIAGDTSALSGQQKYELVTAIKKIDTSMITKGLSLYHAEWKKQVVPELKTTTGADVKELNNTILLKEANLIKGHRFGVKVNQQYHSLGKRACTVFWNKEKKEVKLNTEPIPQDFSLNTDTSMYFIDEATGEVKMVVDNNLLNWSGENLAFPSIFANKEDETNNEPTNNEGYVSDSIENSMNRLKSFFQEKHFPFNTEIKKSKVRQDSDSVKYEPLEEVPSVIDLRYEPVQKSSPRLLFGNNYEMVMVHEYKNGWAIPFESDNQHQMSVTEYIEYTKANCSFSLPTLQFKRNEPVPPVAFFLQSQLFKSNESQLPGKEGESLHHLVIRNKNTKYTSERSMRHILPPQTSFQHAMWHGEIFKMSPLASFRWYERHINREKMQMKEYYAENNINPEYLPDPLTRGFRIFFYLDKEYSIHAPGYKHNGESYVQHLFTGTYPSINSCRLTIEDDNDSQNKIVKNANEIIVRVAKGEELFAVVRTILHSDFKTKFETFGNTNADTENGKNEYLTPSLQFRITHATMEPLVAPEFNSTTKANRFKNSTLFEFEADVHFEQVNLDLSSTNVPKYVDDTLPTGDMELHAKWEEYIDDPTQVLSDLDDEMKDWTPEQPLVPLDEIEEYVLEAKVDLASQQENLSTQLHKLPPPHAVNEAMNYATKLNLTYDTKSTKFLEKHYVIKNKSSYTAYYAANANTDQLEKVSEKPFKVVILNTRKPDKPSINKVIPLLVSDDTDINGTKNRTSKCNRFRIYLNRGRLTSGKDERLGILVNHLDSKYNTFLSTTDQLSLMGKDIASDSTKPYADNLLNTNVYFYPSNIVIEDPADLRDAKGNKVKDLRSFEPLWKPEIGCVTFLPKFDRQQELWYVDIEVDIDAENSNSLHTPFFQLALVHYQQHSIKPPQDDSSLENNVSISAIEKSPFLYILPERVVHFKEVSNSKIRVGVDFSAESLVINGASKKTAFVVAVQYSKDGVIWITRNRNESNQEAFAVLDNISGKTVDVEFDYDSRYYYRAIVIELESFDENNIANSPSFTDIIENRKNRVILINTFKM